MNRYALTALFVALTSLPAAMAAAQDTTTDTHVREGQDLALKVCKSCHVVSPEQPTPPVLKPPAPSFRVIANKPGATAESLRTFVLTTHLTLKAPFNMPNLLLSNDEATAVVDYILSLRTQK